MIQIASTWLETLKVSAAAALLNSVLGAHQGFAADTRKSNSKKGKEKHQAHRFVEGWIEFTDKKKARRTAEFLNASRIGMSCRRAPPC